MNTKTRFITELHYRIAQSEFHVYDNAQPLIHQTPDFCVKVDASWVVFYLNNHYTLLEDARGSVDPFIKSWQIHACLENGIDAFNLVFEHGVVEYNDPVSGDKTTATLGSVSCPTRLVVRANHPTYPAPPQNFTTSQLVEVLFQRYKQFEMGQETLPAMAYFCLTAVEFHFLDGATKNKRKKVASELGISEKVLRELGNLTERKGKASEARKSPLPGSAFTSYSRYEREWIMTVIKLIIHRVGERELTGLPLVNAIDMTDLPDLGS